MKGVHDLGGMQGFGPVQPEPESAEPVFHEEWESRVYGIVRLIGLLGLWNIDMSRHYREQLPPADYLANSYYENWFAGIQKQLVGSGLVSEEELRTGRAATPVPEHIMERVVHAEQVRAAPYMTASYVRPEHAPAQFALGDRVRAVNRHPRGHTRVPGYVRGHTGIVREHYGSQVYPDLSAQGVDEGRHLYNVRFDGRDLWGESANANSAVYVDLWESYLEPAP